MGPPRGWSVLRGAGRGVAGAEGLRLPDCFITAAGGWARPGNKPAPAELDRCREYLVAELALLSQMRVVLALGRIGHDAWLKASGWWARLPARERPRIAHAAE